jgi:hypothetical protein
MPEEKTLLFQQETEENAIVARLQYKDTSTRVFSDSDDAWIFDGVWLPNRHGGGLYHLELHKQFLQNGKRFSFQDLIDIAQQGKPGDARPASLPEITAALRGLYIASTVPETEKAAAKGISDLAGVLDGNIWLYSALRKSRKTFSVTHAPRTADETMTQELVASRFQCNLEKITSDQYNGLSAGEASTLLSTVSEALCADKDYHFVQRIYSRVGKEFFKFNGYFHNFPKGVFGLCASGAKRFLYFLEQDTVGADSYASLYPAFAVQRTPWSRPEGK